MKIPRIKKVSKLQYFIWQVGRFGLGESMVYFFMQRILGINHRISWPVHWSSVVFPSRKIIKAPDKQFPGYSPGCYIQAHNGLIIGRNVRVGPNVCIVSANHDTQDFDRHIPAAPIRLGNNVWIGANAIILPGVTLGNHVIVAAGAVVTKSIPSDTLVAGIPAKIIKKLPPYKNQRNENINHIW